MRSDKPGVLYGDSVDGPFTDLVDIKSEIENVCVKGKVIAFEDKALKNENHMILFDLYDMTDSISAKLMLYPEFYEQGKNLIREGIEIAKRLNKFKGGQVKKIENELFDKAYQEYMSRKINKKEMAEKLHISRPTLDKLIREHEAQSDAE